MRLLICGDRNWTDRRAIVLAIRRVRPSVVITGGANGADSIAYCVARNNGIQNKCYPADWDKYGKGAGPIRNQLMLDDGKPDCVFAFHNDLPRSKGTADMISRARKAWLPVYCFTSDDF